jgi:hypothetical protein
MAAAGVRILPTPFQIAVGLEQVPVVKVPLAFVSCGCFCGFGFHLGLNAFLSLTPCQMGGAEVGFCMNFQLLTDWQGTDCKGWYLSEKADGWRVGVQDGKLITRGGNFLNAPAWFMDGLPEGIDSELFAGRGNFNLIQGMMRDGWHGLTLQVFDAVIPGPFRARLAYLKMLELPDHCQIVPQIRCKDAAHLIEHANAVVDAGGEGSVVRDPRAPYVAGRSGSVLRWVPVDPAINRRRAAA